MQVLTQTSLLIHFSHIFKRLVTRLAYGLLQVLDALKKLSLQEALCSQPTPPTSFLLAFKHQLFLASRKAPCRSCRQWCSLTLPNSSWTCWVLDVSHSSAAFLKGDALSVVTYWYPTTHFTLPLFLDVNNFIRFIWEPNSKIRDTRLLMGSSGTLVITRLPQILVHRSKLWTWVCSDGDVTAMPVPVL